MKAGPCFADGTAVRIVGEECFRVCRDTVDGVVRVTNDEICAAMKDVFEDRRDLDDKRERLWSLVAQTPHLDWLLLTKRPQNVARLAPYGSHWPSNVWLGATAENQRWLDRRMLELSNVPAKVLFLSCEPLLGGLDFTRWIEEARRGNRRLVDWVIAGGESGPKARPPNPAWCRERSSNRGR